MTDYDQRLRDLLADMAWAEGRARPHLEEAHRRGYAIFVDRLSGQVHVVPREEAGAAINCTIPVPPGHVLVTYRIEAGSCGATSLEPKWGLS